MPYEWFSTCTCLVFLNVAFTLINTAEEGRYGVHYVQNRRSARTRKYPLASAEFRIQRRRSDPSVDSYGELKYSTYSTFTGNSVKKSNITMGSNIVGEKRTIKIGNQVCGAIKDGKHSERWDDKRDFIHTSGNKRTTESDNTLNRIHVCCEEHNKCPRSVPAKTTKFGFTNDIEYAIMSCKCDTAFRKCLKDIKSYTSDAIGHLYFDALKIPCLTFYDDSSEDPSHLDMVSVIPDLSIAHPKIGGAQVILKSTDPANQDTEDSFYTHEQNGIADSKEMGGKSSHPHLVRSMQYPTPKIKTVTKRSKNKDRNASKKHIYSSIPSHL